MFNFETINKEYEAYQYNKFDKFVNQLNLIKEYDYKYGYKSYLHPSLLNFNDQKKFEKEDLMYLNNKKHDPKHFSTCYAPWGCVYINVDGYVFPCMAVSLGNVKKNKLSDIVFSSLSQKFRDTIRKNGTINGCNRCGYLKPKEI
jgi:MoaA/NifB/PqqE/SkfB family radical SAM enzyme